MQFARCDLDEPLEGRGEGNANASGRLADNAVIELEFSQSPDKVTRELTFNSLTSIDLFINYTKLCLSYKAFFYGGSM